MNEKVENCLKCKRTKPDSKTYPYCCLEHWTEMVKKH